MKKLFCLVIALTFGFAIQAQEEKAEEVKEKAKNRAENRVDNKIDNAIEGGLDKLEGLFKKKKKKKKGKKDDSSTTNTKTTNAGGFDLNGLLGGGAPVNMKPAYLFGSDMTFETTFLEKGEESKAEKMSFQYLFPKEATDNFLGMKLMGESLNKSGAQDMMMVMDNGTMLTFMDNGSMKIVTGTEIPDTEEVIDDTDDDDDFFGTGTNADEKLPEYKKTGRTKTILGYTCEEYESETEEYKMNFWVAPTMKMQANGMAAMFLALNKNAKVDKNALDKQPHGMVLELETLDKKTNDKFVMKTTELNLEKETNFNTAGYQQMNLGNMMGGDKN